MLKKIDSQAVLDNFWVRKLHIGKWCDEHGFVRRTFYRVVNNVYSLEKPGRATRHIHAALEREGLMFYDRAGDDDIAQAV